MTESKLYVVATPIGNLEDISARALRVLRDAGLIAAEDTRVARKLLSHFGIHTPLLSYNENNARLRTPRILANLADHDVALVSDAGTPAISDPGVDLVAAARAAGFEVVAVPGPAAPIAALSVAGLRAKRWTFVGFLPRQGKALREAVASWSKREETLVALEAPQRLRASLSVLAELLPARRLAVCRELTKLYEEVFNGTATEALAHFAEPRGEFVIVIEGAPPAGEGEAATRATQDAIASETRQMRDLGLSRAQASALLASRYGLSRRQVYALWLGAGAGED